MSPIQVGNSNNIAATRRSSLGVPPVPPELRNLVYSFMVADSMPQNGSHDLTKHKLPAITAVNRLIRRESLSIFFAESLFSIVIDSNFNDRNIARSPTSRATSSSLSQLKRCGVLRMKEHVKRSVRQCKGVALFRNVEINVVSPTVGLRHRRNCTDEEVTVKISLVCEKGDLKINVTNGRIHPLLKVPWLENFDQQDIDDTVNAAIGAAKQIERKQKSKNNGSFAGLTIEDLERVAKQFRFCATLRTSTS